MNDLSPLRAKQLCNFDRDAWSSKNFGTLKSCLMNKTIEELVKPDLEVTTVKTNFSLLVGLSYCVSKPTLRRLGCNAKNGRISTGFDGKSMDESD